MAHERLTRVCFIDYAREMALVAEETGVDGERRIVAIGRLSNSHAVPEAEFALLVGDAGSAAGWAPSCCDGSFRSGGTRASP